MLQRLFEFGVRNRLLVLMGVLLLMVLGSYYGTKLPVDAFPDTTPVQIQINTSAPSLGPLEIEQEITFPVETAISGLPGLEKVRSISKFGLSQVVADFTDGVDIYRARQLVAERLASVRLAEGIQPPAMGPISTGLGEIFHYIVSSKDPARSLDEIRTLHDWVLKPELRKVAGVAEVNTWGGFELQYQVVVSPDKLVEHGITLEDIHQALLNNNKNVGGGRILSGGQSLLVQGLGRAANLESIANIVLRARDGVPLHIGDVADVIKGHEIRQGAVSAQGKGEVVLGLGFMLMGENSMEVAEALEKKVGEIRPFLPEDIEIDIVYNRTELVEEVIATVKHNLFFGAVLVIITLLLILKNWRAGLCVAFAIPLAMSFTLGGMYHLSIAASLLSLGAMDFGLLVDGSVVMTHANLNGLKKKRLELGRSLSLAERISAILESGRPVLRPIVFGMGIIAVVFLPILTLEGVEGKMFRPMAVTFILALGAALIIAILVSPVFSLMFLGDGSGRKKEKPKNSAGAEQLYTKVLNASLAHPGRVFALAAFLTVLAALGTFRLGGEFIPRLSEGSIVINAVRLPGISLEESVTYNTTIENIILKKFPHETDKVWSRIGTAEMATDPMGTELSDIFLKLKPRSRWKRAKTQTELVAALDGELGDLPGINLIYTQPIEMRLNEMISGIRSDIAVTLRGDDLDELWRLSNEVQSVLLNIQGAADVSGEQITGQPFIQVDVKREAAARLGVPVGQVLDFVAALGNTPAGKVYAGQRVFPLTLRLPDELREDPDALSSVMLPLHNGASVPLGELADIRQVEGPSTINREWGRRMTRAQCNVRGRDVSGFVTEARKKIAAEVTLPEGYVLDWGGQFENLERSQNRLALVVPVVLLLVLLLLRFSLGSFRDALLIYTAIPLAAVGGIFALWIREIPFSVSAAVGFIALSGIAVLNGQVLISSMRVNLKKGLERSKAIGQAARLRLRPVLATAVTDMAGFLPMAISTGVGAEVQRPLATVVVGGVITSTLLTLVILPVLCSKYMGQEHRS